MPKTAFLLSAPHFSLKKGLFTHVPKCVEHEHYVYMNPGSVSIPKDGSWHGYMMYDNVQKQEKKTDIPFSAAVSGSLEIPFPSLFHPASAPVRKL